MFSVTSSVSRIYSTLFACNVAISRHAMGKTRGIGNQTPEIVELMKLDALFAPGVGSALELIGWCLDER